jgi:hypothetical protein
MTRNVDSKINGTNLTVRTYHELADAVKGYALSDVRRRLRAGEYVDPGEQRGHNHVLSRLLCWFVTLTPEDRLRIHREGAPLWEKLQGLPEGYVGELPFDRKKDSVFKNADAVDTIVADGDNHDAHRPRVASGRPAAKERRSKRTG